MLYFIGKNIRFEQERFTDGQFPKIVSKYKLSIVNHDSNDRFRSGIWVLKISCVHDYFLKGLTAYVGTKPVDSGYMFSHTEEEETYYMKCNSDEYNVLHNKPSVLPCLYTTLQLRDQGLTLYRIDYKKYYSDGHTTVFACYEVDIHDMSIMSECFTPKAYFKIKVEDDVETGTIFRSSPEANRNGATFFGEKLLNEFFESDAYTIWKENINIKE